ncbi:MAG: glycine cleavage system protein R [Rhodoferax sp.]|nr:glycine cleavage system protein R [Rhodoferax sp.]
MASIVITLIGPDRPGMVSALSDAAAEHGANWANSLMANFSGQFAGIVQLDVSPARSAGLVAALRALESADFQIQVATSDTATATTATRSMQLDLLGNDHPGIIQTISSELARQGVGIHKLQSHIASGAMSGEPMFHLSAQLSVPIALDQDTLRKGLEGLANEMMVDITFDMATPAVA